MDMHFNGVIFQTHAAELRRRLRHSYPPACVIDVRPAEEFDSGHIPGAISKTHEELSKWLPDGTSEHTEFILVGSGPGDPRVRAASMALRQLGAHRRVELTGGIMEWEQLGYELTAQDGA
ncbi:MAG: rhodanese-like domain-containing protein [Longimicrobiales bacterium]